MNKEPSFDELTTEQILPGPVTVKRKVQDKTVCKRCRRSVVRDRRTGEYRHTDEQWRSEKLHGHLAEARYERHANT